MRKRSIRSKITLCLMAIITVMILLSGILSVIFIKKYYYNELKNNLIQTYQECDAFFKDSSNKNRDGSYDLDSMESLLENKSDAMIYIVDDVHMKIYTTVNEDTAVFNNLKSIGEFLMFSDSIDANNSQIEREEVEKHKDYKIQITKDKDTAQSYFDLLGFLDNGFVIIVRTTIARVDSTIQTTIKYFMAVLITTAIISCILMYFVSEIFAGPIKRLTRVAKRMATLDFDARIEHPSNDEIGELSCYMNDLSYKLNKTLTELKETNQKLQVEIDEKITQLSRQYFSLPEDIQVTTYDGRAFLNSSDQKYDVIMVDAYQDITIPFQMSSTEFFTLVKQHLNDGGVMVVNMNMRGSKEGNINQYLSDTIGSVFNTVYTVDVAGSTNRELFASDNANIINALTEHAGKMENAEFQNMMNVVAANSTEYVSGDYILTDDKAPVELLGMQVIDELIKDEVAYYKEIYAREGIRGLLNSI